MNKISGFDTSNWSREVLGGVLEAYLSVGPNAFGRQSLKRFGQENTVCLTLEQNEGVGKHKYGVMPLGGLLQLMTVVHGYRKTHGNDGL